MKKLIETPEAQLYRPEIRSAVVRLVGMQLLFEWRYWAILVPFLITGFIALGLVDRMGLPFIGMIGITLLKGVSPRISYFKTDSKPEPCPSGSKLPLSGGVLAIQAGEVRGT